MSADDDIAASLPRPPLPAPARREAAIAAAMRRFDGLGEPASPDERRAAAKAPWLRRPYAGALAGAALVAVIALPLAWTSLDEQPYRDAGKPPPAATSEPAPAAADAVAPPLPSPPPPSAPGEPISPEPPAAEADKIPGPAPVVADDPAPKPDLAQRQAAPAEPVARKEAESGNIVVTGSRIARPNLDSAAPLSVVGESEEAGEGAITVTGTRITAAARAGRRLGDWNACTVEDPRQSLAGCRASPPLAAGLAKAWSGDWEEAIKAFDSAIEAAPRSAAAWLNRGLARRRLGDLDRALADLDRAVRFSPRAARGYYHRGQVLRQRGDVRRARADEARAVELDPRYGVVIPTDGGR